MCRSEPHTPVDVTRTIASSGASSSGSGLSSIRTSPRPWKVTARIARETLIGDVLEHANDALELVRCVLERHVVEAERDAIGLDRVREAVRTAGLGRRSVDTAGVVE